VLSDLRKIWSEDVQPAEADEVTLHYLNGKVHVDLVRSNRADNANAGHLSRRLQEQARALDYIGDVRVYRQL
jgi:hypothetical protein